MPKFQHMLHSGPRRWVGRILTEFKESALAFGTRDLREKPISEQASAHRTKMRGRVEIGFGAIRYSRKMKFMRRPLTSITSPSLSFFGPLIAAPFTFGILSPGPT